MLGIIHSWLIHELVLVIGSVWTCEFILKDETQKDICWEIFRGFFLLLLKQNEIYKML